MGKNKKEDYIDNIVCIIHPKYKPVRAPRCSCKTCHFIYNIKHKEKQHE